MVRAFQVMHQRGDAAQREVLVVFALGQGAGVAAHLQGDLLAFVQRFLQQGREGVELGETVVHLLGEEVIDGGTARRCGCPGGIVLRLLGAVAAVGLGIVQRGGGIPAARVGLVVVEVEADGQLFAERGDALFADLLHGCGGGGVRRWRGYGGLTSRIAEAVEVVAAGFAFFGEGARAVAGEPAGGWVSVHGGIEVIGGAVEGHAHVDGKAGGVVVQLAFEEVVAAHAGEEVGAEVERVVRGI